MENGNEKRISINLKIKGDDMANSVVKVKGVDLIITDKYNQSVVRHIEYDEYGREKSMSDGYVPRKTSQQRAETTSDMRWREFERQPKVKTSGSTIRLMTAIISMLFLGLTIKDYFFGSGEFYFLFLMLWLFFGLLYLYYQVKVFEDLGRM